MEYEVFLSFRGSDTRCNFTSILYHCMVDKGIRVFKDDKKLKVGEKIQELFIALNNSQIYIPIFSQNFASSAWCLREIVRMVDCTKDSDGKKHILPIFLDVKPEDVKSSTGLYSNALSKLGKKKVKYGDEEEEKYHPDEVKRWGDAVRDVADRVGLKLEGQEYGELVSSILRTVQLKLTNKERSLPVHFVETDDLEDILKLLDLDCDDHVLFVIINGTGGIGKSTLAKVIFNQFRSKFTYSSFLDDVPSRDLLSMQKKLLSETVGWTFTEELHDTNDGIDWIRKGLSSSKVLLVVDNVDEKKQFMSLAGSCNWFGRGSRIIVTVRDKSKIQHEEMQMQPSNYLAYSVQEMPLDQAIQLFNKHAFRGDTSPKDSSDLAAKVISSIGRLPLTLEVVGSLFANTSKSEWENRLKDLVQVPCGDIEKTLMLSINKLKHGEKVIFLEIACFCVGEDKTNADYMWKDRGYSTYGVIENLCHMSLIKIDKNNKFWMHDELRNLGRHIVKEKNEEDAGKRAWVWIDEKTSRILRSNNEKPDVRALSLGINHDFRPAELAIFPELIFLGGKVGRLNFVGDFKDSLHNLRWLSWHHSPLNLRVTNLCPMNLVVLDLSESEVTHDWIGWGQIKKVETLKVLDLTKCRRLIKTPDFSEFGELEILILTDCAKLSTIDSSIGQLQRLRTLNIDKCSFLQGLPKEIGSLKCLLEIIMPSWSFRFELPETLGNLNLLKRLEFQHCGIKQIPHSIERLTNLTHLILRDCGSLHMLPDSIGELKSLVELDLEGSGIVEIPNSIGKLKILKVIRVGRTKLETIPSAIGGVEMLEEVHAQRLPLRKDEFLQELSSLTRLRILNLHQTQISRVPMISDCSRLQTLIIESRKVGLLPKLPLNLKCLAVSTDIFPVLPDLSNLVQLDHLEVWKLDRDDYSWPKEDEVISISPWEDPQSIDRLPRSLSILRLGWIPQLPNLSDFKSLSFLYIHGCPMQHFPDLENLERLKELEIWWCQFLETIPNPSCLKRLQNLQLIDLPKLAEIPGLGELESLKFLHIIRCNAIEQLPNLSNLENLQRLKLDGCEKMRVVRGLKGLKSLKNVEIHKCMSLEKPDLPAFTKLKKDQTNASPDIMKIIFFSNTENGIRHDHNHNQAGVDQRTASPDSS